MYFGRVLKLFEFEVDLNLSHQLPHWQSRYKVAMLDWVSGMEIGRQQQVHKNCEAVGAFSAATIEDVCVIRRMISVVNHAVPSGGNRQGTDTSRSTARRGKKRCYFIDDDICSERLLDGNATDEQGVNRILHGIRVGGKAKQEE